MNRRNVLVGLARIEDEAMHIGAESQIQAMRIRYDVQMIRNELRKETGMDWHLRSDPPVRQGQRCLCRYVYDCNPDYPVYMVLSWNECCEVPHFDNERDGVMRVTHWMEVIEPETGERLVVG